MKNKRGQTSKSLLVMVTGSTSLPSEVHLPLMQEKSATLQHVCSHQVFPQEHILR